MRLLVFAGVVGSCAFDGQDSRIRQPDLGVNRLAINEFYLLGNGGTMYIAIMQIPGISRTKEKAMADAGTTIEKFSKVDGLLKKYFLNGEAGGGGVYIWESKEAADKWYTKAWEEANVKRFGVKPILTCYDNYVFLDNQSRKVNFDGLVQDIA